MYRRAATRQPARRQLAFGPHLLSMKSHGEFSKWLMHDDQKDLFEVIVAGVLSVVFLALIVLLLWPLNRSLLGFRLAKGYAVLWVLTWVVAFLGNRIHDLFRVNLYDRANAFIISNLAVSCSLQVGWSAFASGAIHSFASDAPVWLAVILYLVGFFSCLIAFLVVTAFYQGHIYKLVSLPLALLSFVVFAAWPAVGRLLFGWLFDLS